MHTVDFVIYLIYLFIHSFIHSFFVVNWFRRDYGRTESVNSHDDSTSPVEGGFIRQASLRHPYGKSSQKPGSRYVLQGDTS